jgi:hypothetical protein
MGEEKQLEKFSNCQRLKHLLFEEFPVVQEI